MNIWTLLFCTGVPLVIMMYSYQKTIGDLHTEHAKEIGILERKLLHEGQFLFRDVDHPLKEEEYNKELKAGVFNEDHAVLNAQHFLRVGPKAGDGSVERNLVPGGGSTVRLWTSPALDRRTNLQLENMDLWNKGPTKWKIPVEFFHRARAIMQRFIFSSEVYVDVTSKLLGRVSITASLPVEREIVKAIVEEVSSHSKNEL